MHGAALVVALLFAGCELGGEDDVRFNADDAVDVHVTAEADLGEAVSAVLRSTTGSVEIGSVTVDPGSGPVGTRHGITVLVTDDYEDDVTRVVVTMDSGDRGVEDVTLIQDSADHGLWWREVVSSGTEGESRTDTFRVALYTAADTDGGLLP